MFTGVKLECPSVLPGLGSAQLPWMGAASFRQSLLGMPRAFLTIVLCRDRSENGRVVLDKEGKPELYYPLGAHDRAQLVEGLEMLLRVAGAVGATKVLTTTMQTKGVCELPPPPADHLSAADKEKANAVREDALQAYISQVRAAGIVGDNRETVYSAHQMGTCK